MSDAVTEFHIDIPQADLDDLQARLARTRWPEPATTEGWDQGTPLQYMRELVAYWASDYDWRRAESLLNSWPQFRTELDGPGGTLGIQFLHLRSPHADAMPLLLTHGWPGSVLEFRKVIGPLTDPAAHGGNAADAFHLVCPTLPGFGFSDKPEVPGWGIPATGVAWHQLMGRLGYDRYVAQGGDWGGILAQQMGVQAPDGLAAIHVNFPIVAPDPATMDDLSEPEQSALGALQYYRDVDTGYSKQQATKPQTLGYGLTDSPVGQAAWIIEKFHRWMDCNDNPESVVDKDELLDNVMLYWLTATATSSARFYRESISALSMDPIGLPAGITNFPGDFMRTSRRWAETRFSNLIHFSEQDSGGHFAALEVPEVFVDEVRACFRTLR